MPSRKVRLFIVEGSTDETALGLLLERLLTSESVEFDIFGADIFGHARLGAGEDPVMREPDILKRIHKVVTDRVSRSAYDWRDLSGVVILTDTDGCFVDESLVFESSEVARITYYENHLETAHKEATVSRNQVRSGNIMRAVGRGSLSKLGHKVPLAVYYLSRNLEHALHGEVGNLTTRQKVRLARMFSDRYKDKPELFVTFLREDLACASNYQESWQYIQEGTHSLERGSNLHLLFD